MTSFFIANPLFPRRFQAVGVGLVALGTIVAGLSVFGAPLLTPWTLSVVWKLTLVSGLFMMAMTREPNEDEVIMRLRHELAHWALAILTLNTVVNILISDNRPMEAYKVLIPVLAGYVLLFRTRISRMRSE